MAVPKDIQDRYAALKEAQRVTKEAYEVIRTQCDYLQEWVEKTVQERWVARFGDKLTCKVIASSGGGEVFFYSVEHAEEIFYITDDGRWCDYDYESEQATPKADPPGLRMTQLLHFFKEVEEDIPYKFDCSTYKVKTAQDISEIRSFGDIQLKYAHLHPLLVCKGEVWYTGWDISDKYVVVKMDNGQWAFYSTDAHGGSMRHIVEPGNHDELESFERFLSNDKGQNASKIRHDIEDSWK